jgi:8-oxo-dGTP pyrophosphatase MutT (NUDIX family)
VNDGLGQRLADRLTSTERERRWPNVRPRDASTLIILDRTASSPKVLMGKRHHGHKFMPGKFVFPGGRIELGDRRMAVAGALNPRTQAALEARLTRPPLHLGRALALAAIRETFEETGYIIGTKEHDGLGDTPEGWEAFRERRILPDLTPLHFVARAITPPRRPKRFDTRFFAVDRDCVVDQVPGVIGPDAELVEMVWVSLEEAQALELPPITKAILEELQNRLDQGFGHDLPVPFYYELHRRFRRDLL